MDVCPHHPSRCKASARAPYAPERNSELGWGSSGRTQRRSCTAPSWTFPDSLSIVIVVDANWQNSQQFKETVIKSGIIILNTRWTHRPERIRFFLNLSKSGTQVKNKLPCLLSTVASERPWREIAWSQGKEEKNKRENGRPGGKRHFLLQVETSVNTTGKAIPTWYLKLFCPVPWAQLFPHSLFATSWGRAIPHQLGWCRAED